MNGKTQFVLRAVLIDGFEDIDDPSTTSKFDCLTFNFDYVVQTQQLSRICRLISYGIRVTYYSKIQKSTPNVAVQ